MVSRVFESVTFYCGVTDFNGFIGICDYIQT